MSTSGSTNFTQTRNEVIIDAFTLVGRYSIGRSLSAEDMNIGNRFLNKMLKAWSAQGIHLWAKTEGMLFLTPEVGEYDLSSAGSSYWANKDDVIESQIALAASNGATSITIGNTTGMLANDYIGVVLDSGSIHWTRINSVTSSTTLTLSAALTGAAGVSNLVYTFTTMAEKPLRVLSARMVQGFDSGITTTQVEFPMTSIGYEDYFNLAMRTTNGSFPNQFHYNPKVSNGRMYLWPRPTTGANRLQLTYERAIQDLDNPDDNFDLPSEWLECITYQLSVRLGPIYGKDARTMQTLMPMASILLKNMLDWDNEITSISARPDFGGYDA